MRNGIEVDKIYLSAFEGCVYDTSADTYLLEDEQITDFDNDKLSSIADAKPCSGLTQRLSRANTRKLAHNRGNGWEQSTIQTIAVTQLLFIIEYATFDSQKVIGMGNISQADDGKTNSSIRTGASISIGNGSSNNLNGFLVYRGEENYYGNMWTPVDGINISVNNNYGHIFFSGENFVDDTEMVPYIDTGLYTVSKSGYISAFGYSSSFDWLFMASEMKGNDKLPVNDFCWNNRQAGWRILLLGGSWTHLNSAGLFGQYMNNGSSTSYRNSGARLIYVSAL